MIPTKRTTSAFMEDTLEKEHKVLDHGFIRVVDYMGDDESITEAARVSYGRGTNRVTSNEGLIRYLMRRYHTSPFEMCEVKFHVKLPIFVARQWIRTRMASVNEYSARYSILGSEFYLPEPERICYQSKTNKQGSGSRVPKDMASDVRTAFNNIASDAFEAYNLMIDDNIARETARQNLPLSSYTEMYWKIDLHNLLNFLRQRADSHAQWEIQQYAHILLDIVKGWVPQTYQAFMDYRYKARNFSSMEVDAVRRMLAGIRVTSTNSGMSKKEWEAFIEFLDVRQI